MADFCGLINRRGQPARLEDLAPMLERFEEGAKVPAIYLEGNLAAGPPTARVRVSGDGGERRYCLLFSGALFNKDELRDELSRNGCKPESGDEAELILVGYQRFGPSFLRRLEGQFGMAIYDPASERLLLARDKLGINPLYYMQTPHHFLFSTDMKAILRGPGVEPRLNRGAMFEYMTFRHITLQETMFDEIRMVKAGHLVAVEREGSYREERYWDVKLDEPPPDQGEDYFVEGCRARLIQGIRRRIEDGPIGVMLSGGIDSTALVALLHQYFDIPIKTYCCRVEGTDPGPDSEYSDFIYARLVANRFKTDHREVLIDRHRFSKELLPMIHRLGEPIMHPNYISYYLLAKEATKDVATLLSANGAELCFITKTANKIVRSLKLKRFVPSLIATMIPARLWPRGVRALKPILSSPIEDVILLRTHLRDKQMAEKALISRDGSIRKSMGNRYDLVRAVAKMAPLSRLNYTRWKVFPPCTAMQNARCCSCTGVDFRIPFFDSELAQFAFNTPVRYRAQPNTNRHILMKIVGHLMPREVMERKKSTGPIPLAEWLRDEESLGRYLPLLLDPRARERGLFRSAFVEEAVRDHLSGRGDHSELLWTLLNFELWHRIFIDRDMTIWAMAGRQGLV